MEEKLMFTSLYDLNKANIDKGKLVQVPVQVTNSKGVQFTRKQWKKIGDLTPEEKKNLGIKDEEPAKGKKPVEKKDKKGFAPSTEGAGHTIDQVRAFQDKFGGTEGLLKEMKKQGITWQEHDHPSINGMRAKMALKKHLQEGKPFGEEGNKDKPEEKISDYSKMQDKDLLYIAQKKGLDVKEGRESRQNLIDRLEDSDKSGGKKEQLHEKDYVELSNGHKAQLGWDAKKGYWFTVHTPDGGVLPQVNYSKTPEERQEKLDKFNSELNFRGTARKDKDSAKVKGTSYSQKELDSNRSHGTSYFKNLEAAKSYAVKADGSAIYKDKEGGMFYVTTTNNASKLMAKDGHTRLGTMHADGVFVPEGKLRFGGPSDEEESSKQGTKSIEEQIMEYKAKKDISYDELESLAEQAQKMQQEAGIKRQPNYIRDYNSLKGALGPQEAKLKVLDTIKGDIMLMHHRAKAAATEKAGGVTTKTLDEKSKVVKLSKEEEKASQENSLRKLDENRKAAKSEANSKPAEKGSLSEQGVLSAIADPKVKAEAEKRISYVKHAINRMLNSSDGRAANYKGKTLDKAKELLRASIRARRSGEKLNSDSKLAAGPYGSQHKYSELQQWEDQQWKAAEDSVIKNLEKINDSRGVN